MAKAKIPLAERFWNKVNKSPGQGPQGDCWEWTGGRNSSGYGAFTRYANTSATSAQRVAWELENGPIPEGHCICHRCDNPPCVKPAHLFCGTRQDNSRDMARKKRQYIPRGSEICTAKLTADAVRAIRQECPVADRRKTGRLASQYGVHKATILSVIHHRSWRHV